MRVLQVNCVYNNNSSTGKLTGAIHSYLLKNGEESMVAFGFGQAADSGAVKLCGDLYVKLNHLSARMSGMMYGGCMTSTARLIKLIRSYRPDIVHLQCINGHTVNIYRLIAWLRNNRIKTVLTLHAEFMYTANCGHALGCERWRTGCGSCPDPKKATESFFFDRSAASWIKMKHAFEGFDDELRVVSVSPWLKERAKQSPILADKRHSCIYNGLDTGVFYPREKTAFADNYIAADKKTVLFVLKRFTDKPGGFKGADSVIRLAERMQEDPVRFLVAGENLAKAALPENIGFVGSSVTQDQLAELYSAADVTLIASKKETFSLITAESLCCGTPVAGFYAGAPEMIALPEYSEFVAQGDIEALRAAVMRLAFGGHDAGAIAGEASAIYSNEKMCSDYLELYRTFLKERQS